LTTIHEIYMLLDRRCALCCARPSRTKNYIDTKQKLDIPVILPRRCIVHLLKGLFKMELFRFVKESKHMLISSVLSHLGRN
jgi:hypothetical protein